MLNNKKEKKMDTTLIDQRPRLEAKQTIEEFIRENKISNSL